jgi:hypothetical protein
MKEGEILPLIAHNATEKVQIVCFHSILALNYRKRVRSEQHNHFPMSNFTRRLYFTREEIDWADQANRLATTVRPLCHTHLVSKLSFCPTLPFMYTANFSTHIMIVYIAYGYTP